jgi:hypothetical protein
VVAGDKIELSFYLKLLKEIDETQDFSRNVQMSWERVAYLWNTDTCNPISFPMKISVSLQVQVKMTSKVNSRTSLHLYVALKSSEQNRSILLKKTIQSFKSENRFCNISEIKVGLANSSVSHQSYNRNDRSVRIFRGPVTFILCKISSAWFLYK